MWCSFIPIRVQWNAGYLRPRKIIIKWLLYAITLVFLEASLHHGNVPNAIYVTAQLKVSSMLYSPFLSCTFQISTY